MIGLKIGVNRSLKIKLTKFGQLIVDRYKRQRVYPSKYSSWDRGKAWFTPFLLVNNSKK